MPHEESEAFAETRMTLGEHLDELRGRLIKGTLAVIVAFLIAWAFQDRVTVIMTMPYNRAMGWLEESFVAQAEEILAADPTRPRSDFFVAVSSGEERLLGFDSRLTAIRPGESFLFVLKICFYAALIFGAPVLLWQMWQFIAAGLYAKEKVVVNRYFPLSLIAFAVGVVFGYFVIVPYGMYFLNKSVSIEVMMPSITVQYYLTFLSGLCLAFGCIFQLPLVMTFLGSMGLVQPSAMGTYRGHFAVGALILSAMLTPPDPFTQMMMAVPLVVLYEIGIWSARVAIRRRAAEA